MGRPSMHAAKFLVAFAFGLAATLAQAAGFRFIEVPADADGPVLNGAIWYPCSEPPDTIVLGPYSLSVAIAGRISASIASSCRRPKTCTTANSCSAATSTSIRLFRRRGRSTAAAR